MGSSTTLGRTSLANRCVKCSDCGGLFGNQTLPSYLACSNACHTGYYSIGLATALQEMDVAVVGLTQGGFPQFQAPQFELGEVRELVVPALNLAIVSFVSMMLTARSFAAKNGYDIDANKEFQALGFANIASAFSQGFAISGADSRTAVNDANGENRNWYRLWQPSPLLLSRSLFTSRYSSSLLRHSAWYSSSRHCHCLISKPYGY